MKSLGGNEMGKNLLGYFSLNSDFLTQNHLFPVIIGLHFFQGELKKYMWQPSLNETNIENRVEEFVTNLYTGNQLI